MMELLQLLTIHYVADFCLQNDWMAHGKSKYTLPLFVHCVVYSLCFIFYGPWFMCFTFLCHFVTDGVTSVVNKWLFEKHGTHWFFVGVGADQLIHVWTLAWTLALLQAYPQ